jgi:hypothetical protein
MKVCIFVVVIVIVVVDAKQPKKCFYNWSMVKNAREFSTSCLYGGLTIIHGDVMVFFFFFELSDFIVGNNNKITKLIMVMTHN